MLSDSRAAGGRISLPLRMLTPNARETEARLRWCFCSRARRHVYRLRNNFEGALRGAGSRAFAASSLELVSCRLGEADVTFRRPERARNTAVSRPPGRLSMIHWRYILVRRRGPRSNTSAIFINILGDPAL